MSAFTCASVMPRGSAIFLRLSLFCWTLAMLASLEIQITTSSRPSSLVPMVSIDTRGDAAASAR
jgi:hypothetical protein